MPDIKVTSTSSLSPQNEAIFEVGKKMLTDSIEVGRDFSKLMMTLCSSSIPIYIGLITFIFKDNIETYPFHYYLPLIAFLLSIIIFSISFFPKYGKYSIEIIEEIKAAREKAINSRNWLSASGFSIFIIGFITAVIIISGNKKPKKITEKLTSLYININSKGTIDIQNKISSFQSQVDSLSYNSDYSFQQIKSDSEIIIIAKYKTAK